MIIPRLSTITTSFLNTAEEEIYEGFSKKRAVFKNRSHRDSCDK
jgi:hypothetical protein